jgi:DNA-binding MarR family transcriptional regulator
LKKQKGFESSPFQHDKADDSPGFLLWKIVAIWQRKLAGIFNEFSITQTQFAILASLLWFEQQNNPPTQTALVEHAKIDKMTLSKAIRKLEEGGLVHRKSSKMDTRTIQVQFSATGRKLIHEAIKAVERADNEFFSCLSERELESYKALTISIVNGNS